MNAMIPFTKEIIETLLSVNVSVIENTEESASDFFSRLTPPMAGTSYDANAILKYLLKLSEKIVYDIEDHYFLKWAAIRLPETEDYKNPAFLIIGPYFTSQMPENLTQKSLLRNNLQAAYASPLKMYYHSIPVCSATKVITIARSCINNYFGIKGEPECRAVFPFGNENKVESSEFFAEEEHI